MKRIKFASKGVIKHLRGIYKNSYDKLMEDLSYDFNNFHLDTKEIFPAISPSVDEDYYVYRFAPSESIHIFSHESRVQGMYFAPTRYMAEKWARGLSREVSEKGVDTYDWKIHKYLLNPSTPIIWDLDGWSLSQYYASTWGDASMVLNYNFKPIISPFHGKTAFYGASEIIVEANRVEDSITYIESLPIRVWS